MCQSGRVGLGCKLLLKMRLKLSDEDKACFQALVSKLVFLAGPTSRRRRAREGGEAP